MNVLIITLGVLLSLAAITLIKMLRSESFISQYCLLAFRKKQKSFISNLRQDSRVINLDSEGDPNEKLTEILQDYLWSKAKLMDEEIITKKFNLDSIIEIAFIVWLIYFTNKNKKYDASKS